MTNASTPRTFELDQLLPGRFRFPTRMTALPLRDGGVALVSAIPITDAVAAEVASLGEVRFLVAPNLLHHLYLGPAIARYPEARVVAPRGLAAKRPDLRIDHALEDALPQGLAGDVVALALEGTPSFDEHALFHAASRTLVVTDFAFHVRNPRGLVANLVLRFVGCHGRFAQSRVWRVATKDRDALSRSTEALLALPFETLIVAHGEPVTEHARERLREAVPWLVSRRALPG